MAHVEVALRTWTGRLHPKGTFCWGFSESPLRTHTELRGLCHPCGLACAGSEPGPGASPSSEQRPASSEQTRARRFSRPSRTDQGVSSSAHRFSGGTGWLPGVRIRAEQGEQPSRLSHPVRGHTGTKVLTPGPAAVPFQEPAPFRRAG